MARTRTIDVTITGDASGFRRGARDAQLSLRRLGRVHELTRELPALRHRARWMEARCEGIPWWRPFHALRRAALARAARADVLRHEVELANLTARR
jgi:hypothetical protein